MTNTYEAPAITVIGSLHSLTLLNKDFTGIDGTILTIPGLPPVGLGPVS